MFFCHSCSTEVAANGICPICNRSYLDNDGCWNFSTSAASYYGEIPKEKMCALIDMARQQDWLTALRTFDPGTMTAYATEPLRTAGILALNLHDKTCMALDFGCGLGPISCFLATQCKKVIAMDQTRERFVYRAPREP